MTPLLPATLSGYIEGYYGRLLSWTDRTRMLDALERHGFNAYFYAPKEDALHRLHWRTPYPSEWLDAFAGFCREATSRGVRTLAGVAPGLDFDFGHIGGGADETALFHKTSTLLTAGATDIALLMDDIDDDFKRRSGGIASEGQAHALLANRLSDEIGRPALVVPRAYANDIAASAPEYLADFCRTLKQECSVFLCGSHIVAESIDLRDFRQYAPTLSQRVVAWDNLYANDYCPRRLFVGPWTGRSSVTDVLLNPTGLIETDLLLLELMALTRTLGDADQAWQQTLARQKVPDAFGAIAHYFDKPPFPPGFVLPECAVGSQQFDALEQLLWKWKSPLAREWYPYLMSLKQDLLLVQNRLTKERLAKCYLPPLTRILASFSTD